MCPPESHQPHDKTPRIKHTGGKLTDPMPHELPRHLHRTNHDTFIDGDHAALADKDVVVELHPFGPRKFKLPDNVVELRPDIPDQAA